VVAELGRLGTHHRLPIALGVLTTDTLEQALERAGGAHGNKGAEAAVVAIEMANLARQFA
jgi:6,7-dimethyl-8-ribityllumazine synthase